MELHHQKHHAAYFKGMNEAQDAADKATAAGDLKALLALHLKLRFNGGGHLNHSMFWKMLCPVNEAEKPSGLLAEALNRDFGGVDALIPRFNAAAAGVQGSGWAWLGYSCDMGRLIITTAANQDPLEPLTGLIPVLGVDCWEHALYLQYKNAKADYLKEVWKVINWREAGRRYEESGGV